MSYSRLFKLRKESNDITLFVDTENQAMLETIVDVDADNNDISAPRLTKRVIMPALLTEIHACLKILEKAKATIPQQKQKSQKKIILYTYWILFVMIASIVSPIVAYKMLVGLIEDHRRAELQKDINHTLTTLVVPALEGAKERYNDAKNRYDAMKEDCENTTYLALPGNQWMCDSAYMSVMSAKGLVKFEEDDVKRVQNWPLPDSGILYLTNVIFAFLAIGVMIFLIRQVMILVQSCNEYRGKFYNAAYDCLVELDDAHEINRVINLAARLKINIKDIKIEYLISVLEKKAATIYKREGSALLFLFGKKDPQAYNYNQPSWDDLDSTITKRIFALADMMPKKKM